MQATAIILLVAGVAVSLIVALPTDPLSLGEDSLFRQYGLLAGTVQEERVSEQRDRRSPGGGKVKLDVTHDDRKGTVASGQYGGTVWSSKDGRAKVTAGAEVSKRLEGGKTDKAGFVNFSADFRK